MFTSSSIDPKICCYVLYQDADWNALRIANLLDRPVRAITDWMRKIDEGIDITKIARGRGWKSSIPSSKKTI